MHSHAPYDELWLQTINVLILVLMEDALAQKKIMKKMFFVAVLILVLMEDALARLKFSALSYFIGVLILVLMEDALAQ